MFYIRKYHGRGPSSFKFWGRYHCRRSHDSDYDPTWAEVTLRVWLKSPPTPPISSLYQLHKQVEQSREFISIKWMFANFWTLFGWSSRLNYKTVISGLRLYVSDRYRLLITVGGVGGDFSQTGLRTIRDQALCYQQTLFTDYTVYTYHCYWCLWIYS